ncbi:MAG: hypothetical protein R8K22_00605 [Mariprofundaceae bacterium]
MLSDFRRSRRRKQNWHRWLSVLVVAMVAGMSLAWMRGCADQFEVPYNQEYRPMDAQKQTVEQKH